MCTVPLDSCTVVTSQILEECHLRGRHTQNQWNIEKSYLLIGLSKFTQTFSVRFLKSSSIHPICINAWGSFSFKISYTYDAHYACLFVYILMIISLIPRLSHRLSNVTWSWNNYFMASRGNASVYIIHMYPMCHAKCRARYWRNYK